MMSPKRRFLAALMGGRVDRPAVGTPTSVATVELMELTGAFFPEVHLDGRKMATLAAAGHEVLGYDNVMPYFSVCQESVALGCEVDWGDRASMPTERTHPCADPEDIVIPEDFLEKPSTRAVLEALEYLRHDYGHRVAIVGKIMGPWTLSYHLNGVQNFLLDVVLNPDRVRRFLDTLKQVTIAFGKAQIRAGADVLCLADHATGDLVRAETYRDFLMPVHQEILQELGCPVILHICGDTMNRLEYILQAGFDAFHFDSKNDAVRAKGLVGGRMSLIGNINNPQTLLQGTPEDVRGDTLYALEAGVEILGPECAVPPTTPVRNLRAITDAVLEWAASRDTQSAALR